MDLVITLTDNKLLEKLGTCNTEDKDRLLDNGIVFLPVTEEKEPSASLTLFVPKQVVYEENKLDCPVM